MKGKILCPRCRDLGLKPQVLANAEDLVGYGYIYLWCKKCRKEVSIRIADISLEQ